MIHVTVGFTRLVAKPFVPSPIFRPSVSHQNRVREFASHRKPCHIRYVIIISQGKPPGNTPAVRAIHDNANASLIGVIFRENTDSDLPVAKKRKLAAAGPSGSQVVQSSFEAVLERLKEEGGGDVGEFINLNLFFPEVDILQAAEGGADCWARPALSPLNAKKDKIGR